MNIHQTMTFINKILILLFISIVFGYFCAEYVEIINVNNNFKSNTCYLSDLSYVQKYRYGSNENVNIVIGNIYYENEQIYNYSYAFKEFKHEKNAIKYIETNNDNTLSCYTDNKKVRIGNLNDRPDLLFGIIIFGIISLMVLLLLFLEYILYPKSYNNINNV